MATVCQVISFDQIGCLNIKLVSGFRKEIPFSFNYVTEGVPPVETPIDLSTFSQIQFNVYTEGNVKVASLSKTLGNGIVLVDNFNVKVVFLKETENLNSKYYWSLDLISNVNEPSLCFVHGNLEIRPRRYFLK